MTIDLRLPWLTGVVLAGGRSSRFGTDKLAAQLDGRPLLHHALEAIAVVADRIVVVTAPGGDSGVPDVLSGRVRVIHDPEPFGGPLVGLAAALDDIETGIALVVGGDMPRLVPTVLHRLAVALGDDHRAASLEVPGRIQPLPMALDIEAARAAATAVLARGGRSLRGLLEELDAVSVPADVWLALDPVAATITDIDRPGDLLARDAAR